MKMSIRGEFLATRPIIIKSDLFTEIIAKFYPDRAAVILFAGLRSLMVSKRWVLMGRHFRNDS
jgi:hypothetical protein